jgi:hypothetical protein
MIDCDASFVQSHNQQLYSFAQLLIVTIKTEKGEHGRACLLFNLEMIIERHLLKSRHQAFVSIHYM